MENIGIEKEIHLQLTKYRQPGLYLDFYDDNRLELTLPKAEDEISASFPEAHLATGKACRTQSPPEWIAEPGVAERYGVVPLWPWFVVVAVVLLVFEWALYHRRWTS